MTSRTLCEMTEEAKAARKAYIKEWKRTHPDRVKQHVERYWAKKAAQQAAKAAEAADPAPDADRPALQADSRSGAGRQTD